MTGYTTHAAHFYSQIIFGIIFRNNMDLCFFVCNFDVSYELLVLSKSEFLYSVESNIKLQIYKLP